MNELLAYIANDLGNIECPEHHKAPEFFVFNSEVRVTACCSEFREHVQKLAVQSAKNFIAR